ncbi:MAG: hypothetical protein RIT27_1200 [Pseudomonadota bacterium]|jgi:hypothetical protein
MWYKIAVSGLLFALSNGAQAACDNIPADLTEPNYGVVQWLGGGFDADRDRITVNSCLNGEKVFETSGANASLLVSFLTDYERILQETNRSKGGKIKIGWFSFGKSRSFTERITKTKYAQNFVLSFDIVTGNGRFNINSNDPLNNLADRVKNNACEFKKYCGDNFVFQTEEGAKLLLGIQVAFDSEENYSLSSKGWSAGVEGAINKVFNVCTSCGSVPIPINVSFNGEIKKALQNLNDNVKQNTKIEVFALQQGGDVAQLGKALGENSALASCSLANVDACVQMADNALAYIRSSEFINGVKTLPGVLNYAHRAYHEVDPDAPRSSSEITPEIETARTQLATEFDNRQADLEKLQTTLTLALSPARQQTLALLKQTLETDIQTTYQTGLLCFSDLVNCPQKANQTLANLQSYDRSFLNPNPNDGLVAYYPFDGNAFDESGNGNDGTVYGATLTTDRNGKTKSAYKLNAGNYIEVADSSLLQPKHITLHAWVNLNPVNSNHMIFGKINYANAASEQYTFGFVNGQQLGFHIKRNSGCRAGYGWSSLYGNQNLPLNTWSSVDATWDGSVMKVYANGELVGTKTDAPSGEIDECVGGNLQIGRNWVKDTRFFNGQLDDVRIYNRALSDAEIKQLHETTDSKANQAPFASFNSNLMEKTVTVDASLSNDPDGTIQSYEWLSSDGQMKSGKTSTFTFEKAGDYSITLTVTDDKGTTSQAVKKVSVKDTSTSGGSCTNATISNCKATFSFETGELCIPCVSVPTALGSQIYAAELSQTAPLQLTFKVNPLTLKPHTFKDSCLATYSSGILNTPCVQVGTKSYNVDFSQRSNSLTFDVIDAR